MTEQEALQRMVAPGTRRKGKYRDGVIQIHLTRACDKSCFNCTQGSNLGGRTTFISPEQFQAAVDSLRGYFGVVGVFGGNPALHPQFEELCRILRESWVPRSQRGIWCNNPVTSAKAGAMRATFDPAVSNLNVHLDQDAYNLFRMYWPESRPVGLTQDSRHSPCYVAMKDVLHRTCMVCGGLGDDNRRGVYNSCGVCNGTGKVYDEEKAWELISNCDINKHWSAMIGVFRGELRAWFCEIAGAQAMLHQDEPDYPDTGVDPTKEHQLAHNGLGLKWWECGMHYFAHQVHKHCHDCGVPLRGHGALAQGGEGVEVEQVSETHRGIYKTKRKDRRIELVTVEEQLGKRLPSMIKYLPNSNL